MNGLRLLELSGDPAEIGAAHGRALREEIRGYTASRLALAGSETWTGRTRSRDEVLALAGACLEAHRAYAPELMDELEACARAAGLEAAELLVTNGFTDFIDLAHAHGRSSAAEDDCTAFIVPDGRGAEGRGFVGQTWDMHAASLPHVLMLRVRPAAHPAFLAFSVCGCVGMIGMNAAGIAIGINNLLGGDGRPGVFWPFVVRKVLQQSRFEDALACITTAPLAGAHNYLLFDRHGRGCNVEATATRQHVTMLAAAPLVHANHCLAAECAARTRPRTAASQASSEARQRRAEALLAAGPVDSQRLIALTRDPVICVRPEPPLEMTTCGAAIMQPAGARMWVCCGLPDEKPFELLHM